MVFPDFKQQIKSEETKLSPELLKFFEEAEKVVLVSFGTVKKPRNETMAEIFKAIGLMPRYKFLLSMSQHDLNYFTQDVIDLLKPLNNYLL